MLVHLLVHPGRQHQLSLSGTQLQKAMALRMDAPKAARSSQATIPMVKHITVDAQIRPLKVRFPTLTQSRVPEPRYVDLIILITVLLMEILLEEDTFRLRKGERNWPAWCCPYPPSPLSYRQDC